MSEIQNESHDWLGEAAENYVRYLFAQEGFQVFAGSKWGADLAVHEMRRPNKWWRIEVRSTDRGRMPTPKPKKKLIMIADFVVNVNFDKTGPGTLLKSVIYPVDRASSKGACAKADVIYLIDNKVRVRFFGKKDETSLAKYLIQFT